VSHSHSLIAYIVALGAGTLNLGEAVRIGIAAVLIASYGYYVWESMRCERDLCKDAKCRYFHCHPMMPHRYRVIPQMTAAVNGVVTGVSVWVREVMRLSESLGVSALLISLRFTPIATELPEEFNR